MKRATRTIQTLVLLLCIYANVPVGFAESNVVATTVPQSNGNMV